MPSSLRNRQASVRLAAFARTLGILALLAGCSTDSPPGTGDGGGGGTGPASSAATVTVTPTSSLLDVGKTVTLAAQVYDSAGAAMSRTVTWGSSDSAVATVSGGVVTARQGGTAVITARSGTVSAVAFLAIVDPAVGSVAVTPANDTIAPGATAQLAAQVKDTAGNVLSGRRVTWQVSDASVATVSSSGVVTAKAPGTVVVRALAQNVVGAAVLTVRPSAALTAADGAGRLALSHDHGCGIALDGITWCWGTWYGKAQGTGAPATAFYHARPDTIHGGHRFTQIVGTGNVTAGLKADGTVWAWGIDNGSSLLGGAAVYTPIQVQTSARFVKLIPGNFNLFGLTADGQLYGWGDNDFGELGIGNIGAQQYPTPFAGSLRIRSVSNEDDYGSLFLTTDGAVYAAGKYGNDSLQRVPSPSAFASIGGYTTYGDSVVGITAEGIAYAVTPAGVARRTGGAYTYRKVAPGLITFGLTTDGRIITWSYDPGTNTTTAPAETVAPGRRFLDIDVQESGMLALEDNGDLVVFGSNQGNRLIEYSATAMITEGTGPYDPLYTLTPLPEAIAVEPGATGSFRVRLDEVVGGFTLFGPRRFTKPVPLALSEPIAGVDVAILPDVLHGDGAEAAVTARVGAAKAPGTYGVGIAAQGAPGTTAPSAYVTLTVPQPPPPSGDGTTLNLVCTSRSTPLPAGFHCLENSGGNLVPGKFAGDSKFNALMHGTYVDEGAGVCFTWNANGTATARYSGAGLGGGGPRQTGTGQWGVIVRKSGVPEGTTTQWYVFTSILDAQTQLLGFDSAAPDGARIMGWQFSKRSCPW